MKILQVITKSNWGGAQRHVFDIASECKKLGHTVSVALGQTDTESELASRLTTAGIRTIPIDTLGRDVNIARDGASIGAIMRAISSEKPDVIHLHSPKAAGLGALSARILGTEKIVYTVHGWAFNEDRSLIQKTGIAFFSWLTMMLATDVILLSEYELAQAQSFPFVSKKLSLIPLGIHAPKYLSQKAAREALSAKLVSLGHTRTEVKGTHVIGTISELHPNKGLIYAINAVSALIPTYPDIMFIVIGEGEQRPYLEALIKEKGLSNNVFLLGKISDAATYLKAFNVFSLTSLKEGLPYALLEAGLADLPVITTSVGGIPEIVHDMHSGILIQPKKTREIEYAFNFIFKHKSVQKDYGKALHTTIAERFKIESMLTRTITLYEKKPEPPIAPVTTSVPSTPAATPAL